MQTFIQFLRNDLVDTSLCNYAGYLCTREKESNSDYCSRHILEDKKKTGIKQCLYNLGKGRRCPKPILEKTDKKDGYCIEHSRKNIWISQTKCSKVLRSRPESCVQALNHYAALDKVEISENSKGEHITDPLGVLLQSWTRSQEGSDIESDSDIRDVPLSSTVRVAQDSDPESNDSDFENPLKYAGDYSSEEVIRIMRDKLIYLQKSYINQFNRLRYLLKEERRRYFSSLRLEKESLMSIHSQPKDSLDESSAYSLIKSLNHYNLPQGKDALFAQQAKVKRRRVRETESEENQINNQQQRNLSENNSTCVYSLTSHLKCDEIVIPLSKYCSKHILEDGNQVLFTICGQVTEADDEPCQTPVYKHVENNTCVYHTILPPLSSQVLLSSKRFKTEN